MVWELDETMIESPTSSDRKRKKATAFPTASRRIGVEPTGKSAFSVPVMSPKASTSSVSSVTTGPRRLARAVDPYEVARSVSKSPFSSAVAAAAARPHSPIGSIMSRDNNSVATSTIGSAWHDERLQKSLTHSNTFQKRLEEQAAEAVRRAEQRTILAYEKKLTNYIKTIDAIEKRKKNDLRLIELRKKAEKDKIRERIATEVFEEEKRALKEEQDNLKKEVLAMKAENSELRYNCRKIATQNKQLMTEIEARQKIEQEVQHHDEIVAQMHNINQVFREAHREAAEDLKRLEEDCRKEAREKKKIQNWINSLITLMESRCTQPKLMDRIHKIEARAKAQRELVLDLRRAKQRSSKRSHQSGTTTELRRKVQNMRKQASENSHIIEDRKMLAAALAARKKKTGRERQKTQGARDETSVGDDDDDFKKAQRANKKMEKRRREIENIVNEMRHLDVSDHA